ncbi:MAG TPA: tetratricopeptide repeat protein [Thermoanaerobaculia bacterium]|nr:tetratricopeptide repeat protein [Thermoanaerobaculia bacterium]
MHFDDEALSRYAEGTSPHAAEIESHVPTCDSCSTRVLAHRSVVETLRGNEVWESEPSPPRQLVVDLVAFANRAKEEEAHARELCDEILTGPASWWPQRLRKAKDAQTAGMVKELLERMGSFIASSPTNALQITALAIDVAHALDVSEYPCDYVVKLRAQAFRDHAYVLSFMGRFPDALEFAERSKRLFEQVPLPEYDLARLALVRASILRNIDRGSEAIQLARDAGETFRRFGDMSRYVGARIWEAICISESGGVEGALAIWKSLESEPSVDSTSRVRLLNNIGVAHRQLGQLDLAATYLKRATEEFALLGMDTETARSRCNLGQTLIAAGRVREALPILRQAWRDFEQLEMIADAALAALQLAEAMLVVGETSEVAAICRDLIARFTSAGMTSRAITALSFLREAVAIGQATPSLVRHVYDFMRELPAERPRVFAPPPTTHGE